MTHNELVEIGYKWINKRCGFGFKELKTINDEIPDVIGFISGYSFLLEAKVSRSDFLSDKKKKFRQDPSLGMGNFRFFITPKGLIKIEDLPEMWGLIEVNDKLKARIVHNPFGKGNVYSNWKSFDKNIIAENKVMYSVLRRLEIQGLIEKGLTIDKTL